MTAISKLSTTCTPLSESDLSFYQENGYLLVKNFVDLEQIRQIRAEVDSLHEILASRKHTDGYGITWEDLPEGSPKRIRQLMGSQNVSSGIRSVCESEKLQAAIEQLIGEPAELFHSKLMMKAAGLGSFTPWHSDWGYWQGTFTAPTQMNAFLAIDPSTIENGCIRYVSGSHKEYQEHSFFSDASGFQIGLPGDINAYDADPVIMEPGDIAFHGSITIHGSEANTSHNDRIMNTFAFAAKNTVQKNDAAHASFNGQRMQRDGLISLQFN